MAADELDLNLRLTPPRPVPPTALAAPEPHALAAPDDMDLEPPHFGTITTADDELDLNLRLAPPLPVPPAAPEQSALAAPDEMDLELPHGPPLPLTPVALVAPAPAAPPAWPRTLIRSNQRFLTTQILNKRLNGSYHEVPGHLRNEIKERDENDFFSLDHKALKDEFYFCQIDVPHQRPPAPWKRTEGPRIVTMNGDRDGEVIGRYVTYLSETTKAKVSVYTSVQEGPNIALFRIRERGDAAGASDKAVSSSK